MRLCYSYKMFKRSFNLSFTLITFGIFLSQVYSQKAIENGKFFGKYEIPEKTSQPIDIDTSKVKEEVQDVPLELIVNTLDKVNLVNDGKSLTLIPSQSNPKSRLEAFNVIYKFFKIQYYWTPSGTGVAGTTEDGENGTPMEIFVYFYNEKYDSPEDARNHRDGMADMSFRVTIDDKHPNTKFSPFNTTVKNVKDPNSSSRSRLVSALEWHTEFSPSLLYYAYPGSYFDDKMEKEYFCSTTIILPQFQAIHLTREQFNETFGSLRDSQGNPLGKRAEQQPNVAIPVITGKSIRKRNVME